MGLQKVVMVVGVVVVSLFVLGLILALTFSSSGKGGAELSNLSPEVQQLCDDFWNWRMRDSPEFATQVGRHEYNEELDDFSLHAYQRRLDTVDEFMRTIVALEPKLSRPSDILNTRQLKDDLVAFKQGAPFRMYLNQLSNRDGIQHSLVLLLERMPREDYSSMLVRLSKVPVQVDQIITLLRGAVTAGITLHQVNMNKVVSQIDKFLVDRPQDSPIYQDFFTNFTDVFTVEQINSIQTKAKNVIEEKITPSFRRLKNVVVNEYVTRPDIAVTSVPNGTELYAQLIRFHTGTEQSPQKIHETGLQEVARIQRLLQQVMQDMGQNMTVQEFSKKLREDPKNFHETEEELLDDFRQIVSKVMPAVRKIFKKMPKAKLEVTGDPLITGAFYRSGTIDGSQPAVFMVGTEDLNAQPKYNMLTLTLHEGNPGHHLQLSHAIESPTVPHFRSYSHGSLLDAPSSFPHRTEFIEGWALYAEALGFDMNLYGDLLELYGHYNYEMLRACRLVVDTGMHALGWTRSRAMNYLREHTAMAELDIKNQIDRYIMWPGQALAYKSGQMQLAQFRAHAERKLGAAFDIKDFHGVVLESVGSMSIVEEEVERWIRHVLDS